MRELLAEMLLTMNQPARALSEFEASLKVAPNRFRGFYGAAKAARQTGNEEKMRSYYEKLVALCKDADTIRPEVTEAKAALASSL
jgi:hypothetical protein